MTFKERVYKVVRSIPCGKVATYGQVAGMIGSPRAARQVGFALRNLTLDEKDVPWWRVVNAAGYLSINHGEGGLEKQVQQDLLEEEGIKFEKEFILDLDKFLWRA